MLTHEFGILWTRVAVITIVVQMLFATASGFAQTPARSSLFTVTKSPAETLGYRLVFDEDFNNFSLSSDRQGNYTWYNGVWFQSTVAPLRNISVRDSTLILKWTKDQANSTTCVSTLSRDGSHYHAWRYGYFEARLRFDVVTGSWPAFWMIPVEGVNSNRVQVETGELDIFEAQGASPNVIYGTIHRWIGSEDVANNASANAHRLPSNVDLSQYHTYAALWKPGRVTWYFDDHEILSAPTFPIFDKQHYALVICSQEGKHWVPNDRTGVNAPSISVQVAWIRVWQP